MRMRSNEGKATQERCEWEEMKERLIKKVRMGKKVGKTHPERW